MKRFFILILVLGAIFNVFGQVENVKKVNIEINKEKPDFDEARLLIRRALEDPSTKDLASTWFKAGEIGYKEYTSQLNMGMLGQMMDEERKGEAAIESVEYFKKADSLAMIPTVDKKGREEVDTKTRGKIVKILQEYYTDQALVRYGVYCNEHQEYEKAYQAFRVHITIPDLPMMQDPKVQAAMPKDTTYYQYLYYAGLFAIQSNHHPEAVGLFETLIKNSEATEHMYQFLYQEYNEVKDSVKAVALLKEATNKFPNDSWFVQNLINHYIAKNKNKEAMTFLDKVIKQQPDNAQYHYIKGNIAERENKPDLAMAEFDKALQLDPNLASAYGGKGRVYYNKAVKLQGEKSGVSDQEYEMWRKEFDKLFRQAIPFFEKAHELDKENTEYMKTLKYLYNRFQMTEKFKKIEAELGF